MFIHCKYICLSHLFSGTWFVVIQDFSSLMARLSGPGKCLSWGWLFHWCLYQISPGLVIRRQCSIFNTLVFSLYPGWLGIETSCWEWGASTMTLDIFFLNLHFFHFWYRISRCCANGWWTRSRWGTRRQGLDMLARSGALPVVVSSSTLWRSIQGMYWWSAWWLKVSASAFGEFFTNCPGTRIREGVRAFLNECAEVGRSEKTAHYLYVNGMDSKGVKLSVQVHLQRGASLSRLTDMWLSTWGAEEESDGWSLFVKWKCLLPFGQYMMRNCIDYFHLAIVKYFILPWFAELY